MDYHEAAEYLESFQQRRPKLGVETTSRMLSHLGDPQAALDCVQIAGSNGKGSTARMLESVLRETGLDVGLFTSPGMNDLRDQIRVNGRQVPKGRIAEYVDRIDPCIERLQAADDMPTQFEVLTALAIHHCSVEDVDVAILEVGIGGRYDATSAVDPVASAVTSVSLEHTDLLGDTIEEIARDKAQVAPAGAPLVTGVDGRGLEAIRAETNVITVGPGAADVVAVETGMSSDVENTVSITASDWSLETQLPLLGQHQATNAGIAATLARQVATVETSTTARGLRGATWPGRFEIMSTTPMVVLDGAHNPGAIARLRELVGRYDYDDLVVVFAAMGDKDHGRMVAELPAIDTAFVARPDVDRAEDVAILAAAFEEHAGRVNRVESVPEATERAIESTDETDFILVTGSLYAVAEARDRWTRLLVPKDRHLRSNARPVFPNATFSEASADAVDHRILRINLRPEQAARVDSHLDAVGGECFRSSAGGTGKFVATVLSGTVPQLQELADGLATEGLGLRHVAQQLRSVLDGVTPTGTFDSDRAAVMGVLNVTPDSFYDGGDYYQPDAAITHAKEMVAAGADVIDVGGESTRPGAEPVSVDEEIDRVVPVVEALSSLEVTISVNTRSAAVAEAALEAGAVMVNDVSGLADPEMRFVVADHDATLVLMHSSSVPVASDRARTSDDVVETVLDDLSERILHAERAGINRGRIVVDPGCGFGKPAVDSFELIDRLSEFRALGCRVMVGHSRKAMFEYIGCPRGERLSPSLGATAMAAERGIDIVRVHDVAENAAVLRGVSATTGSYGGDLT